LASQSAATLVKDKRGGTSEEELETMGRLVYGVVPYYIPDGSRHFGGGKPHHSYSNSLCAESGQVVFARSNIWHSCGFQLDRSKNRQQPLSWQQGNSLNQVGGALAEDRDYVKFVYYCHMCHLRIVALNDTARQLMELVDRAEEAGDKEAIKALTTCSDCQRVLLIEGNR
jgi:hypothetical protein